MIPHYELKMKIRNAILALTSKKPFYWGFGAYREPH